LAKSAQQLLNVNVFHARHVHTNMAARQVN
jgi:hypothetical protein